MDQTTLDTNDNKKPEIKKEKKKRSVVPMFFVLLLLIIMIAGTVAYAYYLTEVSRNIPPKDDDKSINITIEKGMSTQQVAEMLTQKGLIRHPLFLQAYMKVNSKKTIQAGFYRVEFDDKLTLASLVEQFQKGSFEKKLTFIEGWRTEEYTDYLKEIMGDEYATKFAESSYIKEGYMFPDTYIIDQDFKAENLASWMRNTFDKKFDATLKSKAESRGMTPDQVVILASVLEREMNIKSERPKVAGILVKRLENDWPLQADATVQYAKGNEKDWWPKVTSTDLQTFVSPYNTYLNKGLPKGPIANPSLNSIESVVNYEDSPYWFYITGNDGVTRYAETLEEHNQNIKKYL